MRGRGTNGDVPTRAPLILVVDDDAGIRRLVRTGLELEGFVVIEAATLAQARSVGTERVGGVVLDRQLPDGDGLSAYGELQERYTGALVVLHSSDAVPNGYPSVPKGDIDAMVDLFGVSAPSPGQAGPAHEMARAHADDIVVEWLELCRWDPELPVDDQPPIPGSVVAAVGAALERPQPVGWGLDPALEPVAEAYMLNHRSVVDAVAELVCLREAFERGVVEGLPGEERIEAARRLTMIVNRLMTVVVRTGVAEMRDGGFTDPLTGLANASAYELDLQREQARAVRHGRPLTLVRAVVDEAVAGDTVRAGKVLAELDGAGALAYHLGRSQFALLLPDAVPVDAAFVVGPLRRAGLDVLEVGMATSPPEGIEDLAALAEHRMRSGRVASAERVRHEGGPDL